MPPIVPVDSSDPIVALFALLATSALKHFAPKVAAWLGPVTPALVLVWALALRMVLDAAAGEGVTWTTAARGLASAGVAVLMHAQVRAGRKAGKRAKARKASEAASLSAAASLSKAARESDNRSGM